MTVRLHTDKYTRIVGVGLDQLQSVGYPSLWHAGSGVVLANKAVPHFTDYHCHDFKYKTSNDPDDPSNIPNTLPIINGYTHQKFSYANTSPKDTAAFLFYKGMKWAAHYRSSRIFHSFKNHILPDIACVRGYHVIFQEKDGKDIDVKTKLKDNIQFLMAFGPIAEETGVIYTIEEGASVYLADVFNFFVGKFTSKADYPLIQNVTSNPETGHLQITLKYPYPMDDDTNLADVKLVVKTFIKVVDPVSKDIKFVYSPVYKIHIIPIQDRVPKRLVNQEYSEEDPPEEGEIDYTDYIYAPIAIEKTDPEDIVPVIKLLEQESTEGTCVESELATEVWGGVITQTLTFTFISPTVFSVKSDIIEKLPNGNILAIYSPPNPAGGSFITLPLAFWDGTWKVGDLVKLSINSDRVTNSRVRMCTNLDHNSAFGGYYGKYIVTTDNLFKAQRLPPKHSTRYVDYAFSLESEEKLPDNRLVIGDIDPVHGCFEQSHDDFYPFGGNSDPIPIPYWLDDWDAEHDDLPSSPQELFTLNPSHRDRDYFLTVRPRELARDDSLYRYKQWGKIFWRAPYFGQPETAERIKLFHSGQGEIIDLPLAVLGRPADWWEWPNYPYKKPHYWNFYNPATHELKCVTREPFFDTTVFYPQFGECRNTDFDNIIYTDIQFNSFTDILDRVLFSDLPWTHLNLCAVTDLNLKDSICYIRQSYRFTQTLNDTAKILTAIADKNWSNIIPLLDTESKAITKLYDETIVEIERINVTSEVERKIARDELTERINAIEVPEFVNLALPTRMFDEEKDGVWEHQITWECDDGTSWFIRYGTEPPTSYYGDLVKRYQYSYDQAWPEHYTERVNERSYLEYYAECLKTDSDLTNAFKERMRPFIDKYKEADRNYTAATTASEKKTYLKQMKDTLQDMTDATITYRRDHIEVLINNFASWELIELLPLGTSYII